jgi:hypothetical protein
MFGFSAAKLIVYGVIAVAVMILLGLIYTAIGNHFTAPLKLELKAAQQATETAVGANQGLQRDLATLKEQLSAQNDATDQIKGESDRRVAASEAALQAAQKRIQAMAETRSSLIAIANSKGTENGCPAVDKLLTDLANDRVRYGSGTSQPSTDLGGKSAGGSSLRIR